MTQKNPPGYPLPDGELGEDEIVCQLVFLPDRPEYWQALLGAIHYMSTWLAWERDSGKRGKDAAANWREAFELTMGCWRMTCLEDLTTTVTDILELLQNKKDCCDDNITYLPVDPIDTDIIPGDGDPPATYGETAVSDWLEWMEYLCFSAHKYVDYLAHAGNSMMEATRNSAIAIGVIAAILGLLAFSGIGLPIAFGLAAAVVSGLILGGTIAMFDDTEADIEAARDDIVCAILMGGSLADAVEDALGSNAAWDLFFQFIQYDDAIAVMYEGGYEDEFLEATTRDDCFCVEDFEMFSPPGQDGTVDDQTHVSFALSQGCYHMENCQWRNVSTQVPVEVTITKLDTITNPGCSGQNGYRFWDKDSVPIYSSNTKPTLPLAGVGNMTLLSSIDHNNFEVVWHKWPL